jgi:hypothetical protein
LRISYWTGEAHDQDSWARSSLLRRAQGPSPPPPPPSVGRRYRAQPWPAAPLSSSRPSVPAEPGAEAPDAGQANLRHSATVQQEDVHGPGLEAEHAATSSTTPSIRVSIACSSGSSNSRHWSAASGPATSSSLVCSLARPPAAPRRTAWGRGGRRRCRPRPGRSSPSGRRAGRGTPSGWRARWRHHRAWPGPPRAVGQLRAARHLLQVLKILIKEVLPVERQGALGGGPHHRSVCH